MPYLQLDPFLGSPSILLMAPDDATPRNLSQAARRLRVMNTKFEPTEVFADPVAWLARFGIEAELIAVPSTDTQTLAEAA